MWWLATAGIGVMQAFQQRDQAVRDADKQRMQIEWGNHQQALQAAAQNRSIHRKNAEQWMLNQEITKASYEQEAESKVYLRHRMENELGAFSRGSTMQNAQITSALEGRNIQGGSARAIFRAKQANQDRLLEDKSVSYGNASRDISRATDAMLAQRNFGYNDYVKYTSTDSSHIDPERAGKNALMGGLMQAAMATGGQMAQEFGQAKTEMYAEKRLDAIAPDWRKNNPQAAGTGFFGWMGQDFKSAATFDWLGDLFS
jgi:hypothetical protein